MLFSNPEVAAAMNGEFECAWRQAGRVARARIDFPDGTSMERTLGGNVITWICDSEGNVLDVMPGLMDGPTYLHGLARGASLAQAIHNAETDGTKASILEKRNEAESLGWSGHALSQIEDGRLQGWTPLSEPGDRPLWASGSKLSQLQPFPTKSVMAMVPSFDVAVSKFAMIEDPLISAVGRAKPDGFSDTLEEDSWIAENQLRPQALALLTVQPVVHVDELSPYVYRLVLHLDAADPHLGLEKALLGRTDGFLPKFPSGN